MTPSVLVISSHVAASPVGMALAQPILAARGLGLIAAPTVMFGRHPGWGPAGGEVLAAPALASLLDAVLLSERAGTIRAVLAGYMASPGQVDTVADMLAALKAGPNPPLVVVDPVIGDAPDISRLPSVGAGGLFVSEAVAEAILTRLLPLADWITPNLFELIWLAGRKGPKGGALSGKDPIATARNVLSAYGLKGVFLTSFAGVGHGGEPATMGASLIRARGPARMAPGERHVPNGARRLPNGAGDAFALSVTADLARRPDQPVRALSRAVSLSGALIGQAVNAGQQELDPVACARLFSRPGLTKTHTVGGGA